MYHSFVALTGDESMLQYSNDNSHFRFLIRVIDAGYLLIPIYCNYYQTAGETGFWQGHFKKCAGEAVKEQRLLITCGHLGKDDTLHVIAGVANYAGGLVTIIDPMKPGLPCYTLDQFCQTHYAQKAVEIMVLDSAVLEDYQEIPPQK